MDSKLVLNCFLNVASQLGKTLKQVVTKTIGNNNLYLVQIDNEIVLYKKNKEINRYPNKYKKQLQIYIIIKNNVDGEILRGGGFGDLLCPFTNLERQYCIKPFFTTDVYNRDDEEGPQQDHTTVLLPMFTPVIMRKGGWLSHVESGGYYPGGESVEYPINPFSFFVWNRNKEPTIYWSLQDDDVNYVYKNKRDLLLLTLPDLRDLHNWLMLYVPDIFSLLPYNKEDPSFPYEDPNLFAWDYLDTGLICAVFNVDGIIRNDEIIICSSYSDKLKFVKSYLINDKGKKPDDNVYPENSIYYTPSNYIVQKMKRNIHVKRVINVIERVRHVMSR